MRARLASLLAPLLMVACSDMTAPAPDSSPSGSGAIAPPVPVSSSVGLTATEPSAKPNEAPTKPAPPLADAEEAKRFAKANNAFGIDIYKQLRETPGNLAVSPTSLSIALAMAWGGAKGETAAEMKKALHFEGSPAAVMADAGKMITLLESPGRPLKLSIANRLFGEKTYSFEKAYLDSTEKAFGAALEPVDFKTNAEKARTTINGWVEQKTEKRIVDLVPGGALDPMTRLVLVNAVYFLADWQKPFDKSATREVDFLVQSTDKKKVPTMHQQGSFNFVEKDGVKLLELPYKGGEMSMLVALPNANDGLAALETRLTPERLSDWTKSLSQQSLSVALPKFEVNPAKATSLGGALEKLGMKQAFDRKKADFTLMANPVDKTEQLVISRVFHKAFVRVDEKGTEAAAASAVVMSTKGAAAPPTLEFKADHPFIYFIRDNKTGLVLFMGRVADPSVK